MLFPEHLVTVRGGGDLGSGVAHAMAKAGFPVVVADLARPSAIRRTVAFSTAVVEGSVEIEGLKGVLVASTQEAVEVASDGFVAVLVSEDLPEVAASAIVDARMAKRNIDTRIDQASLVIALGPGFISGDDCDVVIETKRGHDLGRPIHRGSAAPNTGVPGSVGGVSVDRVIHSPSDGTASWIVEIGDNVEEGQSLGTINGSDVVTKIGGVVRGLIWPSYPVTKGLKIADVDPRGDVSACFQISDKSRLIGAGVLGATLEWLNRGKV